MIPDVFIESSNGVDDNNDALGLPAIREESSTFSSSSSTTTSQEIIKIPSTMESRGAKSTDAKVDKVESLVVSPHSNENQLALNKSGNPTKETTETKDQSEARKMAKKLFKAKKKLAFLWKKLDKAERIILGEPFDHEYTHRPVKITVETTGYKSLDDSNRSGVVVQRKSGNSAASMKGRVQMYQKGLIEATFDALGVDKMCGLDDEALGLIASEAVSKNGNLLIQEASKQNDFILESLLDALGMDKICGFDKAALEAAVANHIPASTGLPPVSISNAKSADSALQKQYPSVYGKEDIFANRELLWTAKRLAEGQNWKSKRLELHSSCRSSTMDPFGNEFVEDDHEAFQFIGRLADLCEPPDGMDGLEAKENE